MACVSISHARPWPRPTPSSVRNRCPRPHRLRSTAVAHDHHRQTPHHRRPGVHHHRAERKRWPPTTPASTPCVRWPGLHPGNMSRRLALRTADIRAADLRTAALRMGRLPGGGTPTTSCRGPLHIGRRPGGGTMIRATTHIIWGERESHCEPEWNGAACLASGILVEHCVHSGEKR